MRSTIQKCRTDSHSQVVKEGHRREKEYGDSSSTRKLFSKSSEPLLQYHTLADSLSSSQGSSVLAKRRAATVTDDGANVALPMKIISPTSKLQTVVTT